MANSHAFTVSIILCAELIWTDVPGQEGWDIKRWRAGVVVRDPKILPVESAPVSLIAMSLAGITAGK
jgi:hypothetical protein